MIIVESKRKKLETLRKKYPGAEIIDVTSHAEGQFVKFSLFYPHGGIPVPFSGEMTGASVEGIWQGLKVFEGEDCDLATIKNDTMKNIKRTVRKHGKCLGHRKAFVAKSHLAISKQESRFTSPPIAGFWRIRFPD